MPNPILTQQVGKPPRKISKQKIINSISNTSTPPLLTKAVNNASKGESLSRRSQLQLYTLHLWSVQWRQLKKFSRIISKSPKLSLYHSSVRYLRVHVTSPVNQQPSKRSFLMSIIPGSISVKTPNFGFWKLIWLKGRKTSSDKSSKSNGIRPKIRLKPSRGLCVRN